jgi:SAM-dependent methyltransferase
MLLREAVDLIAPSGLAAMGARNWADLGCGDGTFTRALADVLGAGSIIYAMDRNASALKRIPAKHGAVRIDTRQGDFTKQPWPFDDLDGILMANSLHYVQDQATFIRRCESQMKADRHFVIVEYELHKANRWVPYPLNRRALVDLFGAAGYSSIRVLGARPSVYHAGQIYAALITT